MLAANDTVGASMEAPCAPVAATERHRNGEAEGKREADVGRVSASSLSIDDAVAAGDDDAALPPPRPLRALFCTLEFSADTFSGNGTLAQACVRGLASAGVDVVCLSARPQSRGDDDDAKGEEKVSPSRDDTRLHGASALVEVPVPRALWGRLDARSPWREFRDGAAARAAQLLPLPPLLPSSSSRPQQESSSAAAAPASSLDLLSPPAGSAAAAAFDVVFAVDWTGVAAAEALLEAAAAATTEEGGSRRKWRMPRIVFLNFRVFARSAEAPLERELVRRAEGRAVALAAAASVALCAADAEDLLMLAREEGEEEEEEEAAGVAAAVGEGRRRPPLMTVLLPPLRREFAEMPPPPIEEEEGEEEEDEGQEGEEIPPVAATAAASSESGEEGGKENVDNSSSNGGGNGARQQQHQQQRQQRPRLRRKRNLLLCCVRLSPEKEPHRFVEVAEALSRLGVLSELNVVPALVGGGDSEYARGLRERMLRLGGGGGGGGGGGKGKKQQEVIVEGGFVGAAELAARFFDRALLNFHPCLADAYGMSAVEAGSRGAPSVIHRGGAGDKEDSNNKNTVGASALLRAERGESVALDLSAPAAEVAARVAALLRGGGVEEFGGTKTASTEAGFSSPPSPAVSLREVGERARRRARSWGEREHGAALAALARRVVSSSSSSSSSGGVVDL